MNIKVKQFIKTALILAVVILLFWLLLIQTFFRPKSEISSTAVIKEIRSLNRLETATFTIEKIIDKSTADKNIFQKLLFGDKILLVAHGQVIAGFDLSQIKDKDIEVSGKSLKIILPKPQILLTTLDNSQTRVYDRQKGILNTEPSNLESEARLSAEKAITEAACKGNILEQASINARKQLTTLFNTLGFTEVSINIPQASC